MKIIIDHDNCAHADTYSERCLRNTILNPLGHERFCMRFLHDDGKDALTVTLIQDRKQYTLVLETQEEREAVAEEGWAAFLRGEVVDLLPME